MSVHGTEASAGAYAAALRTLYEGAPHEGLHAIVLGEGLLVAGAVNPSAATAEKEARRALDSVR